MDGGGRWCWYRSKKSYQSEYFCWVGVRFGLNLKPWFLLDSKLSDSTSGRVLIFLGFCSRHLNKMRVCGSVLEVTSTQCSVHFSSTSSSSQCATTGTMKMHLLPDFALELNLLLCFARPDTTLERWCVADVQNRSRSTGGPGNKSTHNGAKQPSGWVNAPLWPVFSRWFHTDAASHHKLWLTSLLIFLFGKKTKQQRGSCRLHDLDFIRCFISSNLFVSEQFLFPFSFLSALPWQKTPESFTAWKQHKLQRWFFWQCETL